MKPRTCVLFVALTLAFLGGAVFTDRIPVPVDAVARAWPARGLFGDVRPRNDLTADTVLQMLPWMQLVRDDFAHGRAPLWNPYSFSGTPLLANGQSAPFSPFFLATLFVPLPKQLVAMAGLKIFVSLVFTFLFMKRRGASDAAATFAAIAYAFSVFETVYLYYPVTAVTALFPALAYALVDGGAVMVAVVVAAMLAGGHPESVFHAAIGAAVLLVITRAKPRPAPILAGIALAAPAWAPVVQQVFVSNRFHQLRAGAFGAFPLTALWALVNPNGFGNPVRHNWNWIANYSVIAPTYAGAVVLATALVSRRGRPWALAALVLLVIAMGWSGVQHVPPFSFVANDKLRFVALFFLACAGALWLDRPERRWLLLPPAAALIALMEIVWRKQHAILRPSDWIGIAALAVVAVAALLPKVPLAATACVAVAAELFVFNIPFNALVNPRYYRPRLPIVEALWAHAPPEPFRVVGRDWVLPPNTAAEYGLEDIRGSDPMALASYAAFLGRFTVQDPSTDVRRVIDVDRPELDFLGVRFLIAEPDAAVSPKWRLLYRGADGALYENPFARRRFFGAVREIRGEFTLTVDAPEGARIDSSEPFAAGWEARGAILRERGGFISLDVSPGTTTVELRYRPRTFWWSLAGPLLAGFLLVWNTVRRRGVMPGPERSTVP